MYILKKQVDFFPELQLGIKDPRVTLDFEDECGDIWRFDFIYYNNIYFTVNRKRNEYRLTPMNKYFECFGIKAGDTIILCRDESKLKIAYKKTR